MIEDLANQLCCLPNQMLAYLFNLKHLTSITVDIIHLQTKAIVSFIVVEHVDDFSMLFVLSRERHFERK
jgi:hypothetical protein